MAHSTDAANRFAYHKVTTSQSPTGVSEWAVS